MKTAAVLLAAVALCGAAAAMADTPTPQPDPVLYGTAAYTYGPLKCDTDPCDVTPVRPPQPS